MNEINETPSITGVVTLKHFDAAGNVISEQTVKNLVVSTGREFIANRTSGGSTAVMSHMALGAGNTAAALAQTALVTPLGSRKALSSTTATSNTVTYIATFAAGEATGAVVEAGIFNALTSGTMLCRTVFDVINKGAADSLVVTWVITVS